MRLAAIAGLLTVGAAWALPTYREGPPPAHTGGFGEPLCAACHFDGPLNAEPGSLTLDAPGRYEPGERYMLSIELRHPDMAAAGFQLAVRFADGPRRSRQAGALRGVARERGPARATVTVDTTGISYAHQTLEGAALTGVGQARWTVEWTAPESAEPVAIHMAANAANDDASEFGDLIYAVETRIPGAAGAR